MIPPELELLVEPLERFETIRRRAVRLGDRLADLSYANPYQGIHETTRNAIRETLDEDRTLDLQYSPFGGYSRSRRAVADALRESHDGSFAFADVVLAAGAMAGLHLALRQVAKEHGEVIVPVPCWLDYPLYARAVGMTPVLVPLRPESFDLDIDAIAEAVTERTVAILLSAPANPTGRTYEHEQLRELRGVILDAENSGIAITLISDEAHRDFARHDRSEIPSTHVDRALIVYSFGKYHFMQGQRLGYVAVSPAHPERDAAADEMIRWTRILGLATPTSLMQRAIPKLLSLRHDQAWLQVWRRRFVDELTDGGFSVVRPDATMFVYAATPAGRTDFEYIEEIAAQGLLAMPAPLFHHQGYFRLSLTGSEPMLERALTILGRSIRG